MKIEGRWWARNWKWMVPTGCLSALALVSVCVAAAITWTTGGAALAFFGLGTMRYTDACRLAVDYADEHPQVIEVLGEPVEAGWSVDGSVQHRNGRTVSELDIPLTGPKGTAFLYVTANGFAGEWTLEKLELVGPGMERRVILSNPGPW